VSELCEEVYRCLGRSLPHQQKVPLASPLANLSGHFNEPEPLSLGGHEFGVLATRPSLSSCNHLEAPLGRSAAAWDATTASTVAISLDKLTLDMGRLGRTVAAIATHLKIELDGAERCRVKGRKADNADLKKTLLCIIS
jgi:hypothetical protein